MTPTRLVSPHSYPNVCWMWLHCRPGKCGMRTKAAFLCTGCQRRARAGCSRTSHLESQNMQPYPRVMLIQLEYTNCIASITAESRTYSLLPHMLASLILPVGRKEHNYPQSPEWKVVGRLQRESQNSSSCGFQALTPCIEPT